MFLASRLPTLCADCHKGYVEEHTIDYDFGRSECSEPGCEAAPAVQPSSDAADLGLCPYHSVLATRYGVPFSPTERDSTPAETRAESI